MLTIARSHVGSTSHHSLCCHHSPRVLSRASDTAATVDVGFLAETAGSPDFGGSSKGLEGVGCDAPAGGGVVCALVIEVKLKHRNNVTNNVLSIPFFFP